MIELVKQNKTIELTKPTGSGSGVDMGYINNTFCNALKGSASGEVVNITDASPVEHIVKTSVEKKNFANLTQTPFYNRLTNLVEQTRDTIKVEYTSNGLKWCNLFYELDELIVGETYTISGSWEMSNSNSQGALRVQWVSDSGAVVTVGAMMGFINKSGASNTFTVIPKPTGATKLALLIYSVADSANSVVGDTITYSNIQIEKGTTATPYTPYIADTESVKVLAQGKNWLSAKFIIGGLSGGNGNETNLTTRVRVDDYIKVKPNTRYTISGIGDYLVANRMAYDKNKNWLGGWHNGTTPAETAFVRFHLTHQEDAQEFTKEELEQINALPIQLELGTIATEYEPYKEPVEVNDFTSYDNMIITTDTIGAVVNVDYNRDINKAFAAMATAFATMGANTNVLSE